VRAFQAVVVAELVDDRGPHSSRTAPTRQTDGRVSEADRRV
jgi:hypothetical protein